MEKYRVSYFDEVENDLNEAIEWYKEQQIVLNIRFTNAISVAIHQILIASKAFSIR
jgi:hypothetical protein